MFLFLLGTLGRQATVSHRLVLEGKAAAKNAFILSNVLPYPISYAEVPTGYVFMANGFMPMMKWDGIQSDALTVGVHAPTTAPTISGSGVGTTIVTTGAITGATNATPITITSVNHGLATAESVTITGVLGNVGANGTFVITKIDADTFSLNASAGTGSYTSGGTWTSTSTSSAISGTYTAYARWVDKDGNNSNLSPISNSLVVSGVSTITYTNVPLTDDPKVRRVQLLRNTTGQASVYYVDIDSTDLTVTTLSSTLTDSFLQVQESVPLFDSNRASIANRFAVPPNNKPYLCAYQGRLFAAGEIEYSAGHVEVTFNGLTVQGVGTSWVKAMEGRLLYVVGSPQSYQIQTVDEVAQTLTLASIFREQSDLFGIYTIRSAPAERRLVVFCEAGLFDAWPAVNGIEIEENGDEITGLASADSYLFVLQQRHVYRLSYNVSPLTDGGVFLAADRGCVNNRCWVKVESTIYMMDQQGAYKFAANGDPESISKRIQDLFWTLDTDVQLRITWSQQRFFHASLSQIETLIRWFVCLDGSARPKHALAFNFLTNDWWLESYPCEIGASTLMRPVSARPIPIVVAANVRSFAIGPNALDMVVPRGPTRGTATSWTLLSLTDSTANFQANGLVGAPVFILDGVGKGQVRTIASVSESTLNLDVPWTTMPDATSVYQLGGIHWFWRGKWSRWFDEDISNVRNLVFVFEPCRTPNLMNVRLFKDTLDDAQSWGLEKISTSADALSVRLNDDDLVVDLTNKQGYSQVRMDGRQERFLMTRNYFTVEMQGVCGESRLRFYELIVFGAAPPEDQ